MNKIQRTESVNNLQAYLRTIVPAYEDDEGAFEHMAEVQSVINSITNGKTDEEITKEANDLGLGEHIL